MNLSKALFFGTIVGLFALGTIFHVNAGPVNPGVLAAAGMTLAIYSFLYGDNPFFSVVRPGNRDFLVPSPWLAYVALSALFSAILLLFSVRLLRPTSEGRAPDDQPAEGG